MSYLVNLTSGMKGTEEETHWVCLRFLLGWGLRGRWASGERGGVECGLGSFPWELGLRVRII